MHLQILFLLHFVPFAHQSLSRRVRQILDSITHIPLGYTAFMWSSFQIYCYKTRAQLQFLLWFRRHIFKPLYPLNSFVKLSFLLFDSFNQWRIQDFPQGGGAPTPKIAIIFHIFAENCMKMKEFGPPGGARVPGAPPWIRQCQLIASTSICHIT